MGAASNNLRRILAAALAWLPVSACLWAQEAVRTHSVMAGAGVGDVLDTYLSPYCYAGANFRLMRETQRRVRRPPWGGGATFQTLLDADVSLLTGRMGGVAEYAGGVRYSLAWLGRVAQPLPGLHVAAGPTFSGYAGCVYNERNGNNPAQAKADVMLGASASATYTFALARRPCRVRYQVAAPLVGAAFSPNYGQSYYEAFVLGDYDRNVVLAHPLNAPSMRHLLTVDIPLGRASATTLRLGYAGALMQSTFNHLRYHSYTHAFLVGFTQTFRRL